MAVMADSWRSVMSSTSSKRPATACISSLSSDIAADRVFLMSAATDLRSSRLRLLAAGDCESLVLVPSRLVGLQLTSLEACDGSAGSRARDLNISGILPESCVSWSRGDRDRVVDESLSVLPMVMSGFLLFCLKGDRGVAEC